MIAYPVGTHQAKYYELNPKLCVLTVAIHASTLTTYSCTNISEKSTSNLLTM